MNYEHGTTGTSQASGPAQAQAAAARAAAARGATDVARRDSVRALAPTALEARHLIHREMDDIEQVDSFRELRTRLLMPASARHQVTLVTGVGPRCGTTFVAKNLASAIVFDDSRHALLIDCNLRRPALAREFAVDGNGGGLVEFLEKPAIGLPTVIHPTGIPRLTVIPAGAARRHGGEALSTFRMRALVDMLRSRFPDRLLVLDAPPALGSPDACILAELADAVLLVAGEGRHRPEAIAEAARRFPPEKLAGVVFNQLP